MAETLAIPVQGVETTEVGPGYYTFRFGGIRNIFVVTSDGVIATDPISSEAARACRDEIRKVTDLPVKYVVYSHQHWDHVLGGAIYKEEGATFLSHARAIPHFQDMPHPDLVMPDETFEGAAYDLKLGERTLQLRYYGVNHGDCLIVMTPDHVKIPFVCDLATAGGMPLPGIPDYSMHNWIRSLREIEAKDFEYYIGGHGIPLAEKRYMAERREYMEALLAAVKAELDAGTDSRQIPASVADVLKPRFGHLRNFDQFITGNVQRILTYYAMGW